MQYITYNGCVYTINISIDYDCIEIFINDIPRWNWIILRNRLFEIADKLPESPIIVIVENSKVVMSLSILKKYCKESIKFENYRMITKNFEFFLTDSNN